MVGERWPLQRVIVDDHVIAAGHPMAVVDPVWWCGNFYETFGTFEESFQRFSWPQRLVWAVLWCNSEVCNGGHAQFFFNSTGMSWPEALEGLEAIGRDLAKLLAAAVARFSQPPPREKDERQDLLGRDDPDFSELDDAYYSMMAELDEALMRYIRLQPEKFYFNDIVRKPSERT